MCGFNSIPTMKHQLGFDCNNADLEIPLRRLSHFRLQNLNPTAMIQNHDGIFATCDINVLDAWEGPASPRIAKLEEEQAEAAWSCTDVNMGLVDAGVRLPLRLPLKGCLSGLLVTRGVVISLIQGVAV